MSAQPDIFSFAGESKSAITLGELNRRIGGRLSDTSLKNLWVTAETSDLRTKGGHCYFELIEKDSSGLNITSRIKAIIWGNTFVSLSNKFFAKTKTQLASSQKVMVRGSVNFNASFGLSFIINDIDPSYTIGDIELKRREIIDRLTREGIIDMNRRLAWNIPSLRIAVISAEGAAGYGDFIHQLYSNNSRLRLSTGLFQAVMQGEKTSPSIISALDRISSQLDKWDLVVVIRGGGATSDLVSFDDYDLAANIANFPLPVIVGIGHERDVTVLDYVANKRVKTPTAAAELIIAEAEQHLRNLLTIATDFHREIADRINGCNTQLAFIVGQLPVAPLNAMEKARARLTRDSIALSGTVDKRINPALSKLDIMTNSLKTGLSVTLQNRLGVLNHCRILLEAISPEATLKRGYSITRVDGKALTSARDIPAGTLIETTLAEGTVKSRTL